VLRNAGQRDLLHERLHPERNPVRSERARGDVLDASERLHRMERGDGVRGGEGLQRERLRGGVFHRRDVLRLRRFQLGERGRLPDVQPLEDHVELDKPREPSTACISGAGVGACARSGTTVCSGTSIVCGATPGAASSYQTSAAPNGSWDWNCDGKVEMEYAACTLAFCNGAAGGGELRFCGGRPLR
jgi:hypothetical protein